MTQDPLLQNFLNLYKSSVEKERELISKDKSKDTFEDVKATLDQDSDNWDDEFQSRDSGL